MSKPSASPGLFDPNGPAAADSGLFGLPEDSNAKVVVVPVPFAATTSYGTGAERGPEAVLAASRQVDLFDFETGHPYKPGIRMLPIAQELLALHAKARQDVERVLEGSLADSELELAAALARVNGCSAEVNAWVYSQVKQLLDAGKLVALLGGDHATPFGAIRAVAERYPKLGVLHVDAHADLREAYEGFRYSHASIMDNVLREVPGVVKLVQVGIRDFCEEEWLRIGGSQGRVECYFDAAITRRRASGEALLAVWKELVAKLPEHVYVSFDIDGLDPTLCPHTGTPVPGGLQFGEASLLLGEVVRSGRKLVAVDLNEVAPGGDGDEWDGNVGARMLYKLIGWMLVSQGLSTPPSP